MRTRPADAADENETAGQEGYSETFHTFTSMNKELERYIEREIIPRYEDFDAAHRTDHVRTVIAQSLELAAHYDADADMVYTVAAYHDTGLANGRERHHIDAGRILAADTELRRWFSEEQIAVMRDAVEDHRASSDGEPRTIYGRIVAEADRVIDPETIIRRTVQYGLAHCPELDREEQYARCLAHLQQKYAEGGYLRLWIAESENARRLESKVILLINSVMNFSIRASLSAGICCAIAPTDIARRINIVNFLIIVLSSLCSYLFLILNTIYHLADSTTIFTLLYALSNCNNTTDRFYKKHKTGFSQCYAGTSVGKQAK